MVAQLRRNQHAHDVGEGEAKAKRFRITADLGERDAIELVEECAAAALDRGVLQKRGYRMDGLAVELRRVIPRFHDEAQRQREMGFTMALPDLLQSLFRETFPRPPVQRAVVGRLQQPDPALLSHLEDVSAMVPHMNSPCCSS
ncbi:MAG: hypothetical protein E5W43_00820 [Mesorhizobium sp.]|nr:MAG: hypothetical protein E5W43_00820 [Mesorhizobium sp.]